MEHAKELISLLLDCEERASERASTVCRHPRALQKFPRRTGGRASNVCTKMCQWPPPPPPPPTTTTLAIRAAIPSEYNDDFLSRSVISLFSFFRMFIVAAPLLTRLSALPRGQRCSRCLMLEHASGLRQPRLRSRSVVWFATVLVAETPHVVPLRRHVR